MIVTVTPTLLRGTITPPPSKSQGHRLLMAALLAGGTARDIENLPQSQDMSATIRCMEQLTAPGDPGVLDCGESGSTLRFLIPLALALKGGGRFTGHGRLMERPQGPYFRIFEEKGIRYRLENGLLTLSGQLTPGVYTLPGDVSSQFVTGLLYALPLLEGDSEIRLSSDLESQSYVDLTVDALNRFGIKALRADVRRYTVPGGQRYRAARAAVEADWSQAGFWYAGRCLGNNVELDGLAGNSLQGDRRIVPYCIKLRAPGRVSLDVSDCPDLVPPLALCAALRAGQLTRIVNAGRLRMKESDRLDTVSSELNKLGAKVEQGPDFLAVTGVQGLTGGAVCSHNDHRIAMMLAIAATRAKGQVAISGAEAVAKSYPGFWEDYERLGGKIARD